MGNIIHSILLIGQSNMAGRGVIGDVPPIENAHLKVLRNGRWQPMFVPVNPDRPFSGLSLAESFADDYQKDHDTEVGLIPCADGGTQIEQWKEGSLLFDHAVFQAKLAQRTSTIAAVLWHQGESDCDEEKSRVYLKKMEAFYEALCRELGLEDVPFIAGGLGDFLSELVTESRYYQSVNAQLEKFAQSHEMTGYVPTSGLAGKPDHLHFTAASLRELGHRYYDVFRKLERADKIFMEKPNEDDALRTGIDGL